MWLKYKEASKARPALQSLGFSLLLQIYLRLFPRRTVQHAVSTLQAAHNAHAIGHRPCIVRAAKAAVVHHWYRWSTYMAGKLQIGVYRTKYCC